MKTVPCLIIILLSFSLKVQAQNFTHGKIAGTQYSDFDVPTYTINAVLDFNADNSGVNDASVEIQAALNIADSLYGGIVYLPSGNYLIENPLIIPEQVTLRGDWKRPSSLDKTVAGTVLYINYGAGDTTGAIALEDYAMLRDLSIYYPQQDLSSVPINYPYTVEGLGVFSSIRNVTLVNSYNGLKFVPQGGQSVKFPTVIGVYGCPISTGIFIHQTSATPRVEDVHFGPDYWSQSQLGLVDNATIKAVIDSLQGIAILSGKGAGGGIFVGVEIDGYHTGIKTTAPASPRVFDLNISNCKVGIDFNHTKDHGWVITGGSIHATDTAVHVHEAAVNIQFNNMNFSSDDKLIIQESGTVGFTKCSFDSWSSGNAIESDSNYLSVTGCDFQQVDNHIELGNKVSRAIIYSNSVTNGSLDISNFSNGDTNDIVIDTTSEHDFIEIDRKDYPFMDVQLQVPSPPPGDSHIFTVTDYGAVGNGIVDDTDAFQTALDSAGNLAHANSGCIVFIPTGVYRLNRNITVPEYVELRGINDNPTNGYGRSILALFGNKGNPLGPSDIHLEANSGVKSLYLYRPEQTYNYNIGDTLIHQYPYAISGTDKNWAYNVILSNLYNGINFSSGGGHHLDFVFGCSLNQLVKIESGSSSVSIIENFQAKTEAWRNAAKINFPTWNNTGWSGPTGSEADGLGDIGNGIQINGNGEFRFMGHFVNRTGGNLYDINGSPTLNMYLCGGEGEGNGSLINSIDGEDFDIEMVGNSYHTFGASYTTSYTDGGDKLHVINCKNYGDAAINHHFLGSGEIVMHQEYRGRSHDITLKLEGSTRGIVESGFLEKGAQTRIRTLDQSCAKLCGAITVKPEWPFNSADENQIYVESVSPAILKGISGNGIGCDSIFSISDLQFTNEILLYPNPTQGNYTLDCGSDLENELINISVYDLTGKKIESHENPQGRLINLQINQVPGIYLVVVKSKWSTATLKLIKI